MRQILFHFKRRINVISTLIQNVKTTLILRGHVGWDYHQKLNFRVYLRVAERLET